MFHLRGKDRHTKHWQGKDSPTWQGEAQIIDKESIENEFSSDKHEFSIPDKKCLSLLSQQIGKKLNFLIVVYVHT